MQVDSVFLKVPSRAIPGSLKAVLSLTGAKIHDDGSTSYCILASCRPRTSFLLLIPAHSISILVSVISIGMITVGRGYIVNLKSMSFQPVMAFRKKTCWLCCSQTISKVRTFCGCNFRFTVRYHFISVAKVRK